MISANEIRNRQISVTQVGYDKTEVNTLLDEAAQTVDAYVAQSQELFHKLEVLAAKVEEYRDEEDSIKAALITAEKMADKIKKEAKETADELIAKSEKQAKILIDSANKRANEIDEKANEKEAEAIRNAEQIIIAANKKSGEIISEKTAQANRIVSDAEKKANEAISSAKIVSKNVLDQAKEISEDLISKSKEEKEAYELLIKALKEDAASFIDKLKTLYTGQLDVLNGAKLESGDSEDDTADDIDSLHKEVEGLVSEISEMEAAIPDSIYIEKKEKTEAEESAEEETVVQEDVTEEAEADDVQEAEETETPIEQEEKATDLFEIIDDEVDEIMEDISNAPEFELQEEDEEIADPMEAVAAFSRTEVEPIDENAASIPEINDDVSLFDEDDQQPFESYFNVKQDDAHGDRTQTISLVPPEDEDDDEEPKFKGFFKKKK